MFLAIASLVQTDVSLGVVLIGCVLAVVLTFSWVASEVALLLANTAGTTQNLSCECLHSLIQFTDLLQSQVCSSSASKIAVSSSSGSCVRSIIH